MFPFYAEPPCGGIRVFGHLDGLEERLDSILCVSAANELARHTV